MKKSLVLRALKILRFEDILKLSEVLSFRRPLKKVAGDESIVWDDAPTIVETESQILPFPRQAKNSEEKPGRNLAEENDFSGLTPSEFIILQRSIGKSSEEQLQKLEAFKGYQKFTEMYVIKPEKNTAKDKIRFAATQGVLINKKQN